MGGKRTLGGDVLFDERARTLVGTRHRIRQAGVTAAAATRGETVLCTIGYAQRDVDALIAALGRHGVEEVVDVRDSPSSRKPGFSKTPLAAALAEADIGYRHVKELGVPREHRAAFRAGEPHAIARYRAKLDDESRPAVEAVVRTARLRTIALLCLERDVASCHRQFITAAAQRIDSDLPVRHID